MGVRFRQITRVVIAGCGLLLFAVLRGTAQASTPPPPEQMERVGQAVLEALQAGAPADFILVMGEQADLSAAYQISDWEERGRYVWDALQTTASQSQARAAAELKRRGLSYRSFVSSNEIYVYAGDGRMIQAALALPEVARVRAPVSVTLQPAGFHFRIYGPAAPQAQIQATVDWGITDTKADQFWSAYGRTGEGIVVANIDTGVDAAHPALAEAYRCAGGNLTDPACWLDATDACNGQVCDDHGHGTHTMGTMAASNDSALLYTVGMAPGVEWIACKACTDDGNCTDVDLLACADWILAPDGNPDNRPHVVNNSWGDVGGNDWFLEAVEAWRAAGVFPAFSAGNSSTCKSLGSPGDYQASFSSAAHASNRAIASFSSKGPGFFGDSPYTKPNLSAPGVLIWSTTPNNYWGLMSGTSMASPHTAGAVALLWSCAPSLAGQIDATFQQLQSSADPAPEGACDAPTSGEGNYTFGYGYLNVLAAGSGNCTAGLIQGQVSDSVSGLPVEGATMEFSDGILQARLVQTASDGSYLILLPEGSYSLQVIRVAYKPYSLADIQVVDGQVTTVDIALDPAKVYMLPLILNAAP